MKIYKIVFSPTGGTQKVADILANAFGSESEELDLTRTDFKGGSLNEDGIAIISVPSFGGRAPKIAIDRLKMIRGNSISAIIVAVYGNRAQEDTLIEVTDTAKECGFRVIAGIEAVAEHSIIHRYATGRPDKDDEIQLANFVKQILANMKKHNNSEICIPGNRPYKKSMSGLIPKTLPSCAGCGLCVSRCPVGAISKETPRFTDKATCITCMRCVSICPHGARTVNSLMVRIIGFILKKRCSIRKNNRLYL